MSRWFPFVRFPFRGDVLYSQETYSACKALYRRNRGPCVVAMTYVPEGDSPNRRRRRRRRSYYSYSSDTVEGSRAPAVKLTAPLQPSPRSHLRHLGECPHLTGLLTQHSLEYGAHFARCTASACAVVVKYLCFSRAISSSSRSKWAHFPHPRCRSSTF